MKEDTIQNAWGFRFGKGGSYITFFESRTDQPHVGLYQVVSAPCQHYVKTCWNIACFGNVDVDVEK